MDLTLHEDTTGKCKLTVYLSCIADKKSQRETEARPKVSCEIPCLAKLLVSFFLLGNEKDEALFSGIFSLVETGSGIYNMHNYARCHARLLGVSAYCSFVLQPLWEDFFLIYQYCMCLFRGP